MQAKEVRQKQRIPELDGLRGLAILQVVFFHYVESVTIPRYLSAFGRLTWTGLDLFLLLSGFLIGGILLDTSASPNYFKSFFLRRVYRIIPVYAVMLLTFWLGVYLSAQSPNPALGYLFRNPLPWYTYATLTQNFLTAWTGYLGPAWLGISWTLAVEGQFYVVLSLLIRYTRRSYLPFALAGFIVTAPLFRTLLYLTLPHGGWAAFVLMPCRADALMLGVVAALSIRNQAAWDFLVKHSRPLKVILCVLFIGMGWAAHKRWVQITTFPMSSFGYTWVAFFYFTILLISIVDPKSLVSRVSRNRLLRYVGIVAYGVYIFHVALLGLCFAALRGHSPALSNPGDVLTTLLAFIATFFVAWLSWICLEKPFIKLGDKYRESLSQKRSQDDI